MTILTEKEVAELLKISPLTLGDLRRAKKGPPCIKIGGQIRYSLESVKNWVEKQQKK